MFFVPSSFVILKRRYISTANISKTQKFMPRYSGWMDGATGGRKNMHFLFWDELSLYPEMLSQMIDYFLLLERHFLRRFSFFSSEVRYGVKNRERFKASYSRQLSQSYRGKKITRGMINIAETIFIIN